MLFDINGFAVLGVFEGDVLSAGYSGGLLYRSPMDGSRMTLHYSLLIVFEAFVK